MYYVAAFPTHLAYTDKHMELTVRILFVIGLLVNFIKLADLLLRPHQQKWLQTKFESLTLYLSYTKPIDWYTENGILQKWFWVFVLIGILLLLGFVECWCLMPVAIIIVWLSRKELNFLKWLEEIMNAKAESTTSLDNLFKFFAKHGHALLSWLLDSETYLDHIFRSLTIVLIQVGVLYLLRESLQLLGTLLDAATPYAGYVPRGLKKYLSSALGPRILKVAVALFIILIVGLVIIGLPAALVALFMLLLFIAEVILKVMRGIAWRVVEYNKGVWAALVLIITAALGITEIILKFSTSTL